MKKTGLILSVIIMLMMFFSSISYAQEESSDPVVYNDKVTIEDATADLTNRLILSVMGPTALQVFVSADIQNLDQIDYQQYTNPFPYIYPLTSFFFSFSAIFGFAVAVIYFSYILYDSIMKSQTSGSFLGNSWNTLFVGLKTIIAFSLVIPFGFNFADNQTGGITNGAQMLVIKVFGISNEAGAKLNRKFQESTPRMFPQVKMPYTSSIYSDIAVDMIEFSKCLNKETAKRDDGNGIKDNVSKTISYDHMEDKIVIAYSAPNCDSLIINVGTDRANKDIIMSSPELVSFFSGNYQLISELNYESSESGYNNYISGLIKGYDKAFERALTISAKVVDNILLRTHSNMNVLTVRDATSGLANNINNIQDAIDNSVLTGFMNSTVWEKNCNVLYDYNFGDSISEIDKSFYIDYVSYCISYEIANSLIYPNYDEKYYEKIYESSGDGVNYVLLCANPNDSFIGGYEYSVEGKTVFDCVQEMCSSLDSNRSNMYLCSSSLSLYSKNERSKNLDSLGFLVLGGVIYNSFLSDDNKNATELLSSISSKIDDNLIDYIKPSSIYTESLNLSTPNQKNNVDFLKDDTLFVKEFNEFPNTVEWVTSVQPDNPKFLTSRIYTCAQNPFAYVDGFMCGSIPQEYNMFGQKLLNLYVISKVAKITGSLVRGYEGTSIKSISSNAVDELAMGGDVPLNKRVYQTGKKILKFTIEYVSVLFMADIARSDGGIVTQMLSIFDVPESDRFSSYGESKYKQVMNAGFNSVISYGVPMLYYMEGRMGYDLGILDFLSGMLLIGGILMGYVIPLLPFWFYLVIVINILVMIFSKIFIFPILAAFIMKPTQDDNNEMITRMMGALIEILFKVPLTIVGLITSWVLTNSMVSKVFKIIPIESFFVIESSGTIMDSFTQVFVYILQGIVFVILFYIITNLTMGVMEAFEKFVMSLVRGSSPNIMLNSGATDLSSKIKQYAYYGNRAKGQIDQNLHYMQEKKQREAKYKQRRGE